MLRRALAAGVAREAHAARVRQAVLAELVAACERRGVRILLLKGAGLACTAYPDAGLRPMRDLDLMVLPADAPVLVKTMAELGFVSAGQPTPSGHHHLPAQVLMREHARVFVEPHTDLGLSPRVTVAPDALFAAAESCEVGGVRAWVPGLEHMLWHVYRHGFTMPFATEATKLVWLADLHVLAETRVGDARFAAALKARPRLRRVLAAMHAAVPWSPAVQRALAPAPLGRFRALGDYAGWPRSGLGRDALGTSFRASLQATLLPPDLWLAMRQGARVGALARSVMHVRHWRDLLQAGIERRARGAA